MEKEIENDLLFILSSLQILLALTRTLIGVVNLQDKQFFQHNHWNYYGRKGFDTKIQRIPT